MIKNKKLIIFLMLFLFSYIAYSQVWGPSYDQCNNDLSPNGTPCTGGYCCSKVCSPTTNTYGTECNIGAIKGYYNCTGTSGTTAACVGVICDTKYSASKLCNETNPNFPKIINYTNPTREGCPINSTCVCDSCIAKDCDNSSFVCLQRCSATYAPIIGRSLKWLTTLDTGVSNTQAIEGVTDIKMGSGVSSSGYCCGDDKEEQYAVEEGNLCYDGIDNDCDEKVDLNDDSCRCVFERNVLDSTDLSGINSATVTVKSDNDNPLIFESPKILSTDSNGNFTVTLRRDYNYTIEIKKANYETTRYNIKKECTEYNNLGSSTSDPWIIPPYVPKCEDDCTYNGVCNNNTIVGCGDKSWCQTFKESSESVLDKCNGKPSHFMTNWNTTHDVICCTGVPYIKNNVKATVNTNLSIVPIVKNVFIRGKVYKMNILTGR